MADTNKLLDHESDGIQEYDNDLPLWWRNIFLVTGVFGVLYIFYMHFGIAEPQHDQLARELKELNALQNATAKTTTDLVKVDLMKLTTDQKVVALGKELFMNNCVACHGANGQGLVGPNLTDKHWIHGGKIEDIKRVIEEGVPAKGMIPWKTMLKSDQLTSLAVYIWTLQGTNPQGAKPPEGNLVE